MNEEVNNTACGERVIKTVCDGNGGIYTPDYKTLISCCERDEDRGKITYFRINDKCLKIGDKAFAFCHNMERIDGIENLESIGRGAFCDCHLLKDFIMPSKIVEIPSYAFYGCRALTNIGSLENVLRIHHDAFYGCMSLSELKLPKSYISIGEDAFTRCDSIPDDVRQQLPEWREITKAKENK